MATKSTGLLVEDGKDGLYDISYTIEVDKKGITSEQVKDCIEERSSLMAMLPNDDDDKEQA